MATADFGEEDADMMPRPRATERRFARMLPSVTAGLVRRSVQREAPRGGAVIWELAQRGRPVQILSQPAAVVYAGAKKWMPEITAPRTTAPIRQ
jgi:hypothetical protein